MAILPGVLSTSHTPRHHIPRQWSHGETPSIATPGPCQGWRFSRADGGEERQTCQPGRFHASTGRMTARMDKGRRDPSRRVSDTLENTPRVTHRDTPRVTHHDTHIRVSGNTHTRVLGNTHTRVLTIPLAWGLPSIPLDKSLQLPQIIQKPTIYANIFVYSQEKAYICDRNRINMHL